MKRRILIKANGFSYVLIIFTTVILSSCGPKALNGYLEDIASTDPHLIFKDSFDGNLNSYITDANNWESYFAWAPIQYDGSGNAKLEEGSLGFGGALYSGNTASLESYVQATYQHGFTSGAAHAGAMLLLRMKHLAPNGYMCQLVDGDGTLFMDLGIGFESPVVQSVNTNILSTTTDPITVGCEISETGALNGYVNGSLVATYILGTAPADSPILAPGLAGFILGSEEMRIGDFKYYEKKPN